MTQEADQLTAETNSTEFVGRWHELVSTTNWEKGRIILEWRQALMDAGAPATNYSDETWSAMVSAVTPQHVGRLRRVYERFYAEYTTYGGLYWSHFHAAIDWEDAELWLEGAVQNGWSVSQMRRQRWETLGAISNAQPNDEEIVASDVDEDVEAAPDEDSGGSPATPTAVASSIEPVENVGRRTDPSDPEDAGDDDYEDATEENEIRAAVPPMRPFAELPELPDDLVAAFEAYKLAILRHKMDGWREISLDDVLLSLDSLRQLAMAPSQSDLSA